MRSFDIKASIALALGFIAGCGGIIDSVFGDGKDDSSGNGGPQSGTFTVGTGTDAGEADEQKACTGLCFQQVKCESGGTTSVSGTVMDPAGKNPLYNVLVYVPNAPVDPIVTGATCDRCGSVSGNPLVTAITDTKGQFKLTDMPVGKNIPLVVQVGKWRRQLVIPEVPKCKDTALKDDDIRLPKSRKEGDIPLIALTTGGADVMECLLRKVGVDDSEFSIGDGPGRIQFYEGSGETVTNKFDASHNGGQSFSKAQTFWSDVEHMKKYDMIILSCEGQTFPETKPPVALKALYDYANAGGRVFASHWHRFWFSTAPVTQGGSNQPGGPQPSPFENIGVWNDRDAPGDANQPATGNIDTSFPKGAAMSDWLVNVKASTVPSQIPINESKHNIDSVSSNATQWITMVNNVSGGKTAVEYLSFNTPIPAPDDQKCGRVVYSDLHVSSGDQRGKNWPQGCVKPDLSPQEKALEFMLFDLSSCVQSDKLPPSPPPPVK